MDSQFYRMDGSLRLPQIKDYPFWSFDVLLCIRAFLTQKELPSSRKKIHIIEGLWFTCWASQESYWLGWSLCNRGSLCLQGRPRNLHHGCQIILDNSRTDTAQNPVRANTESFRYTTLIGWSHPGTPAKPKLASNMKSSTFQTWMWT